MTIKEILKQIQKEIDTIAKLQSIEGELTITHSLTCIENSYREVTEGMIFLNKCLKMPLGFSVSDQNLISNGRVEIRFGLRKSYSA